MSNSHSIKLKVLVWVYCRSSQSTEPFVLILKTLERRGGFWQPITGSVEGQESLDDAALREMQEESGLKPYQPLLLLGETSHFRDQWGSQVEEHGFYAAVTAPQGELPSIQMDPHEHSEFKWVPLSAAGKLLKYESNRKMLSLLVEKIAADS